MNHYNYEHVIIVFIHSVAYHVLSMHWARSKKRILNRSPSSIQIDADHIHPHKCISANGKHLHPTTFDRWHSNKRNRHEHIMMPHFRFVFFSIIGTFFLHLLPLVVAIASVIIHLYSRQTVVYFPQPELFLWLPSLFVCKGLWCLIILAMDICCLNWRSCHVIDMISLVSSLMLSYHISLDWGSVFRG